MLMCCISKLTIGNISLGHFKVFKVKNTTWPFKKYSNGPVLTVGNSIYELRQTLWSYNNKVQLKKIEKWSFFFLPRLSSLRDYDQLTFNFEK